MELKRGDALEFELLYLPLIKYVLWSPGWPLRDFFFRFFERIMFENIVH